MWFILPITERSNCRMWYYRLSFLSERAVFPAKILVKTYNFPVFSKYNSLIYKIWREMNGYNTFLWLFSRKGNGMGPKPLHWKRCNKRYRQKNSTIMYTTVLNRPVVFFISTKIPETSVSFLFFVFAFHSMECGKTRIFCCRSPTVFWFFTRTATGK